MAGTLKGRHFLKLLDFTPAEIRDLLELSATLKAAKRAGLRGRTLEGRATAYVCRDFVCRLPTTDPARLAELLTRDTGSRPV